MKVLVTGGAGFIGSHLVDKLKKEGHAVWIMDDFSGGSKANIGTAQPYFDVDCRDAAKVDAAFKQMVPILKNGPPFDIVYHLAANAAENKAQFSPIDITTRNYDAFIKVLTPFIKYGGKRFVFTSSIAVYGALQTPFKETDKPEPEDLYGITKLAAEQTLKVMSKVHGFEYVIARPHNVYGPRQNMTDPYRNVMTIWMNAILKGESVNIYGDGEQRRCFSYIDDVVEALVKCGFADVAQSTFNIGSDHDYSLNRLSSLLAATAIKDKISSFRSIHLPDRAQEVKIAISDHTLAKAYLKYEDKTPLAEGIKKTWEWVKQQGPQEPIYDELEIDSPLVPSNWKKPNEA